MELLSKKEVLQIQSFIRLPLTEQAKLLRQKGLFLDQDTVGGKEMNLYFLNGYFVEESINSGEIKEIIPFKSGYRLSHFIDLSGDEEQSMLP